jgi:hypothetical protein
MVNENIIKSLTNKIKTKVIVIFSLIIYKFNDLYNLYCERVKFGLFYLPQTTFSALTIYWKPMYWLDLIDKIS